MNLQSNLLSVDLQSLVDDHESERREGQAHREMKHRPREDSIYKPVSVFFKAICEILLQNSTAVH